MHLPPDRFLNCIYVWCIERIPQDKREAWEHDLISPLPGEETRVTEEQAEEEGAAFMAMMQINQQLTRN